MSEIANNIEVRHGFNSPASPSQDANVVDGAKWNDPLVVKLTGILAALDALNPANGQFPVFTGPQGAELKSISPLALTLLALASAADMRAALAVSPTNDPTFTGAVTVPSIAGTSDNSNKAAPTSFVQAVVEAAISQLLGDAPPAALDTLAELAAALGDDEDYAASITTALALKAPLASPALTGSPTAPTVAGTSDNSTAIATTAFVQAVRALLAPLASPEFTGDPTVPDQTVGDNSGKIANTKYAEAAAAAAAAAVATVSAPRVLGLRAANNVSTPNTQFDIDCDAVVLRRSSDGATATRVFPGSLTCNVSTAGPVANGRDQAGAFSSGTWVHFYYIWNGTTLATLASASAPSTGPTLPSGYTHTAYVGAVYFTANLASVFARGSTFFYSGGGLLLVNNTGLTAGATMSSLSLSAAVPPNTLNMEFGGYGYTSNNTGGNASQFYLNPVANTPGSGFLIGIGWTVSNGVTAWSVFSHRTAYVTSTIYYGFVDTAGSSASMQFLLRLKSYTMPNGGE